ncbi:LexA family protein [Comamonas terrae]|nr:translesion error-prone DNA polymerase V autoproteolytic subunit [Comamonas terrae]
MYSSLRNLSSPVPVASLVLPLVEGRVRAGFPSPAEDFVITRLDLTALLVKHPLTTFMMELGGDSMIGAGLYDGDLLVVDKVLKEAHGDIVIAEVDGEFTCKRLFHRNGIFMLRPENPTYPDIRPKPGQIVEIWGVVTSSIRRFRKW